MQIVEMTSTSERLRKAREIAGYNTAAQAAEAFGWKTPTYHSHENGTRGIRVPSLTRYAKAFRVRFEWLANGTGTPKRGGDFPTDGVASLDQEAHPVPLIDYVAAGKWRAINAPYEPGAGMKLLYTAVPVSRDAFALTIEGTSMEPDFHDGDHIIVDPAVAARPGDLVVAKRGDEAEATFKRYRPRGQQNGVDIAELVPLNPDWPSMMIDNKTSVVVGTMVEHRRYRR
jgi:SOS-response transcriptional repressor LexA